MKGRGYIMMRFLNASLAIVSKFQMHIFFSSESLMYILENIFVLYV